MQPEIQRTRKWKWRAKSRNFTCLVAGFACVLGATLAAGLRPAAAEASQPSAAAALVPGFWDPRRRPERPDLSRISVIRFLTEIDYPPFNFAGPDGTPRGFNVDVARMICEEINVQCTVQMRRFDTLVDAVNRNRGDAIIASMAVNAKTRGQVDFSDPYYRAPARFVSAQRQAACPRARRVARAGAAEPYLRGTRDRDARPPPRRLPSGRPRG